MVTELTLEVFSTECCGSVNAAGDEYREALRTVFSGLPAYPAGHSVAEVFIPGENSHQHLVKGTVAGTDLLVLSDESLSTETDAPGDNTPRSTTTFASVSRNGQEIGLVGVLRIDSNKWLIGSLIGVAATGSGPYLADENTVVDDYRKAVRDLVDSTGKLRGKWTVEDTSIESELASYTAKEWDTSGWLRKDIMDNPGRPVSFRLWRG